MSNRNSKVKILAIAATPIPIIINNISLTINKVVILFATKKCVDNTTAGTIPSCTFNLEVSGIKIIKNKPKANAPFPNTPYKITDNNIPKLQAIILL